MIGVLANSDEEEIVREFFELFKTPWEFCKSGQSYEVIVCARNERPPTNAKLVLLYSSERTSFDVENNVAVECRHEPATFSCEGQRLPLYGRSATFPMNSLCLPRVDADQKSLTFLSRSDQGVIVRLGYDLFQETRLLLTAGQPVENAGCPTLELHIELVRNLITRSGISLIEIPPIPAGYDFIACLTHDLDHPVLRNHFMDHTMFGFLYRATVGSTLEYFQGRKQIKNVWRNWIAACRLPFVYLGLAKDFWREFERYLQLEAGLGATYFVITRKDYAGREASGKAPARRAAGYSSSDIKRELERIQSQGNEVALHGIDAWMDPASGRAEQETLTRTLGAEMADVGVRMHWLYFDKNSPAILEQAGFSHDSSVGYNEAVGFRAGTAQAYKPPGATKLIELPLHIMDTALFYPQFLNLRDVDAKKAVDELIKVAARFGGALTINWHDRSIVPERMWDDFYLELIRELERRKAWFPTVAKAASWFRKRRSVKFGTTQSSDGQLRLSLSADLDPTTPGLRIRVHKPMAGNLFDRTQQEVSSSDVEMEVGDGRVTTLTSPALAYAE